MSSNDHSEGAHPLQVLIVDDHPMVRDSLHLLLVDLVPGTQTTLATSLAELRSTLQVRDDFDYVITDLSLRDASGLDTLRAVRHWRPSTPIVVFSARTQQDTILRCLEFGVLGFIPKNLYNDHVRHALRRVLSGQVYVPKAVLQSPTRNGEPRLHRFFGADTAQLGLTERQTEVLKLILRGLPNKLICRQLDLAEGTVKVHVSAVLRALGVRNRTQAVIAATELGLRAD